MVDAHPICSLAEIPEGGSKTLEYGDEDLFAVKKNGQLFVYRNNCPHDYIPLNHEPDAFLDPSETLIECANHGAVFTIETGECVAGPCMGDYLEAVPYELQGEQVYLSE